MTSASFGIWKQRWCIC